MKDNSVVYFYKEKNENFYKLNDFCTKTNMYFFCCTTIDELMYILLNCDSSFIVVDKDANATHQQLEELSDVKKIYYLDNTYCGLKKNIIIVEDIDKTINKIRRDNLQTDDEIENSKMFCYVLVNKELDKLFFKNKHIGTKYLTDIVYEHYKSKIKNKKCVETFPIIANRYNSTSISVERAIRFAIKRAFESCENKQDFFNISKCKKSPTVKEMISYLLNKVIYSNKKCFENKMYEN